MERAKTALLLSFLTLAALIGAVYVVLRLRRLSALRADAAMRSAAALAELQLVTNELRARRSDDPDEDAHLSPGERLLRRYPGAGAPSRSVE